MLPSHARQGSANREKKETPKVAAAPIPSTRIKANM